MLMCCSFLLGDGIEFLLRRFPQGCLRRSARLMLQVSLRRCGEASCAAKAASATSTGVLKTIGNVEKTLLHFSDNARSLR